MAVARVRGVDFHYCLDGPADGIPVMLSNSLASAVVMWEPQVVALTAAGYRVLRYDNRGHGQTSAVPGPLSVEMMADDACALLDLAGFDTVHFCGLSMGGMIGQMLGTRAPERLRSLTLCDTAAWMGPTSLWDERIAAVAAGGMEAVVDATVARWFTPAGRERLPAVVATIRSAILATSPLGFCTCSAAIRDMDQRESIRAITVPTHVIVGADDPGTPVAAAEFIHERIAGSTLDVLPEAAHLANLEQPERFNASLLAFLGRVG